MNLVTISDLRAEEKGSHLLFCPRPGPTAVTEFYPGLNLREEVVPEVESFPRARARSTSGHTHRTEQRWEKVCVRPPHSRNANVLATCARNSSRLPLAGWADAYIPAPRRGGAKVENAHSRQA